jgi:histidinol dehydrogenase
VELSKKFDRVDPQKIGMKVSPAEIDSAFASVDAKALSALEFAKERIEAHHRRQRPDLIKHCPVNLSSAKGSQRTGIHGRA